ncbi:MAG: type II toxin-antitoxin system RelE/ParE family toxin [Oscillospiraceae bacterium]|nr:type II toxin-antitoxin system RelE/ParE family toxin [Oscillospiraceae bacterium]
MTNYNLIFSPEFVKDLNDTFEYISLTLSNEQAAKKLMKDIDSAIMNLKTMPEMYPLAREPLDILGYRKIIIKNYIIIYSVDKKKENVDLLRCFYGKQNYLRFFEQT